MGTFKDTRWADTNGKHQQDDWTVAGAAAAVAVDTVPAKPLLLQDAMIPVLPAGCKAVQQQ